MSQLFMEVVGAEWDIRDSSYSKREEVEEYSIYRLTQPTDEDPGSVSSLVVLDACMKSPGGRMSPPPDFHSAEKNMFLKLIWGTPLPNGAPVATS